MKSTTAQRLATCLHMTTMEERRIEAEIQDALELADFSCRLAIAFARNPNVSLSHVARVISRKPGLYAKWRLL